MRSQLNWSLVAKLMVLTSLLVLTACAAPAPAAKVFFVEPSDGASLTSPVTVKMAAENFTVEPAGEIHDHAGHLHIMMDTACVAAGQVVPKDDQHLHFGQGQTEVELELTPGAHTLCLQAADGAHVALPGDGMTQQIAVTVQ